MQRQIMRRVERGRLVYYKQKADAAYWDKYWGDQIGPEFYAEAINGELAYFEGLFTKYLPKDVRILEAGCGLGQWVMALRKRGYCAEGVDWGEETIQKVHRIFPDLPIRCGDVCNLDVSDGYYGAYVSLGVMEHRVAGPEPFLSEAFRVLGKGGVALISVPWFNPVRQLKRWAGYFAASNTNTVDFYQYAFTSSEFSRYLTNAGFQIIDQQSYDRKIGFEEEIPLLSSLYRNRLFGKHLKKIIRGRRFSRRLPGHMQIFVCRKPQP